MKVECTHCGAPNSASETVCSHCGAALGAGDQGPARSTTSKPGQPTEQGKQKLGCGATILRGFLWGLGIAIVLLLVELSQGPQLPDNPVAREYYDFTAEVVGHFVTNVIIYGILATAVVAFFRGRRQSRPSSRTGPSSPTSTGSTQEVIQAGSQQEQEKTVCPACGTATGKRQKRCPACGTRLPRVEQKRVFLIPLMVGLIGGIVGAAYSYYRGALPIRVAFAAVGDAGVWWAVAAFITWLVRPSWRRAAALGAAVLLTAIVFGVYLFVQYQTGQYLGYVELPDVGVPASASATAPQIGRAHV